MGNERMFSLDIVNDDKFLSMPASAQALYFHLGMRTNIKCISAVLKHTYLNNSITRSFSFFNRFHSYPYQ